jgi:hypothetical protein
MRLLRFCWMVGAMHWPHVLGVCLFGWVAVALGVGTIVGHGIAFGTSGDPD